MFPVSLPKAVLSAVFIIAVLVVCIFKMFKIALKGVPTACPQCIDGILSIETIERDAQVRDFHRKAATVHRCNNCNYERIS